MASLSFSGFGNNLAVAASTTSASGQLPGADATRAGEAVRVYNATSSAAFFRGGTSTVVATSADTFIAPGSTEVFSLAPGVTHVAVELASGSGTMYFQRGSGT